MPRDAKTTSCSHTRRNHRPMASGMSCRKSGQRAKPHCAQRGGTAAAGIRATLVALEAEHAAQTGRREPLTELPAEVRRALIVGSGLLEQPGASALIAEALCDGVIPGHLYGRFLGSGRRVSRQRRRCGSGWLVEQLLLLSPAKREPISPALREAVFARDGRRCCLAHLGGCYGKRCLDHFVPVILGGLTDISNLWTTCVGHNMDKFGHWPDEELEAALLASGRELPPIYFDLLAQRPWREAHDLDQPWWEEVISHRRRQRRLRREEARRTPATVLRWRTGTRPPRRRRRRAR
jgi:hypothetical protein